MSTKRATTTITHTSTMSQRQSEVVLFDCGCHTYEDAVDSLMRALACDLHTAVLYAETAQQFGQVAVYKGAKEDCEKVASSLSSTGLDVSVVD